MSLGRTRDARKEQQWRRWIALWQSSGLSVAAFCARHNLAQASFYAWRTTLQRRAAETVPFVPVQLVADATPPRPLEVVLVDGCVVRVPPGFDAASLRQLLALLREGPSCYSLCRMKTSRHHSVAAVNRGFLKAKGISDGFNDLLSVRGLGWRAASPCL